MLSCRTLVLLTALLTVPASIQAQGVLSGFVDEAVIGGLTLPVAFTTLPDGRLLVAEKAGVVRVVRGGQLLPDAFIDLRARVNDYWDRGLLGLAVDPAFAHNGFVYLFYVHEDDPFTYSGPKTSRVVRVTAAGDEADPATEVVLVPGIPADSPSHNGGALRFGPDGALWITTGDASSLNGVDARALRTQQIDSLAGKLLRVSADGRGLADNPFWNGDADAVRSKVWAYGFRNPFRLTFRPSSGRPYIADVGETPVRARPATDAQPPGRCSSTQVDCPRAPGAAWPGTRITRSSPAYQRSTVHPAMPASVSIISVDVVTLRTEAQRVVRSRAAEAAKMSRAAGSDIGRHENSRRPPGRTTRRADTR